MGPFTPLSIILAILVVIPATILAGYRRPHGSIVLSSGATLVLSALFWLLGGPISLSISLYNGNGDVLDTFIIPLLFSSGVLLLLASWTLSLNAAALARHWLWVALLGAGLLTFSMIFLTFSMIFMIFSLLIIPGGGAMSLGSRFLRTGGRRLPAHQSACTTTDRGRLFCQSSCGAGLCDAPIAPHPATAGPPPHPPVT